MTARILPESDAELMAMWVLCGRNNHRTAEHYGCNESQVRKRVTRVLGARPSGRSYKKLPKPVEELYAEWVGTGTQYGSIAALARSYGLLPGTLRRAFRRLRQLNSEEDERREQDEDRRDGGDDPHLQWRASRERARPVQHRVPQHAHGGPVR